mmetsp:Transcript_60852/g.137403  ORF Transcript_60852/g.137403 Transcript_60852/m.137403 type:complete len:356 (-) Transcript_60852:259-1326(-)
MSMSSTGAACHGAASMVKRAATTDQAEPRDGSNRAQQHHQDHADLGCPRQAPRAPPGGKETLAQGGEDIRCLSDASGLACPAVGDVLREARWRPRLIPPTSQEHRCHGGSGPQEAEERRRTQAAMPSPRAADAWEAACNGYATPPARPHAVQCGSASVGHIAVGAHQAQGLIVLATPNPDTHRVGRHLTTNGLAMRRRPVLALPTAAIALEGDIPLWAEVAALATYQHNGANREGHPLPTVKDPGAVGQVDDALHVRAHGEQGASVSALLPDPSLPLRARHILACPEILAFLRAQARTPMPTNLGDPIAPPAAHARVAEVGVAAAFAAAAIAEKELGEDAALAGCLAVGATPPAI